ncbi:MAG TPA: zinc carboxypeptidase [Microscillaceae bacterium]|nr:zinc carboxypeptidase [Microscillaceae bacterium]
MKKVLLLFLMLGGLIPVMAQPAINLKYYLPQNISYDAKIPTPKSVLGYEVGEWHVSHDQLVYYMRAVAQASDRVTLEEFGRTHENRPLLLLKITSPKNHQNLEQIRQKHLELCDPKKAGSVNTDNMPVIVWSGHTIHGNEPSGSNAAILETYYWAAAQGEAVNKVLDNTIILMDPCFNPDGLNRFATWANMHKSTKALVTDPASREFNEVFPRGRTNHYWFDLNRDWLPVQHPESQARAKKFQEWRPNILTDHHEMGTNSTYFFQPGVPARTNPLTPQMNQDLTAKIAKFHGKALDKIGSLYFTKEGFDDYYYGKGSTYPDVQGSIGILFEQASSRGHAQESVHGILRFPFTIRNQLTTAMSTVQAANEMRKELLDYQKNFHKNAPKGKSYVFGSQDKSRLYELVKLMKHHNVEVYQSSSDVTIKGQRIKKENAYVVPEGQAQSRLISAMFQVQTQYKDSLFYDVSAWTLPHAFGLPFQEGGSKGAKIIEADAIFPKGKMMWGSGSSSNEVAYVFRWNNYYAPRALYRLQKKGIKAKVVSKSFTFNVGGTSETFGYGAILVPVANQNMSKNALFREMETITKNEGIDVYVLNKGLADKGIDLGSRSIIPLKKPEVLVVAGSGVTSYDVGEVWHLLDTRYHMPASIVEKSRIRRIDLSRYSVIVMVNGSYNDLNSQVPRLRRWLRNGGTLITIKNANRWAQAQKLANFSYKKTAGANTKGKSYPYATRQNRRGAQRIGGAIFEAHLDLSHPLGYGYDQAKIPVFRNHNIFVDKSSNPYATPLYYTKSPLLSGYISKPNLKNLGGSAGIVITKQGRGTVVSMLDNPNFRAFWYGTNKLFANAIFFGRTIGR